MNQIENTFNLSDAEKDQLIAAFEMIDKNKDNVISADELKQLMQSYGETAPISQVQDMINEVKVGGIDINAFVRVMQKTMENTETVENLREAFKVFDKDANGFISVTELRDAMINYGEKLSQEEVEEMVTEADIHKDGHINIEEFIMMMISASK